MLSFQEQTNIGNTLIGGPKAFLKLGPKSQNILQN